MTLIQKAKRFVKFEDLSDDYIEYQIKGLQMEVGKVGWDTNYMKEKCKNIISFIEMLERAYDNDYRRQKFFKVIEKND